MTWYVMPDRTVTDAYGCIGFIEANYPRDEFLRDVVMENNDPEDWMDMTLGELDGMYHAYICESIIDDPAILWGRFGIGVVD